MAADRAPDDFRSTTAKTIKELTALQNVNPMQSTDEWAADIFESDEEVEAFLADVRASRNASIA